MRVEERELDFGVVEKRTYDADGKLVDIQRLDPPGTRIGRVSAMGVIPTRSRGMKQHD